MSHCIQGLVFSAELSSEARARIAQGRTVRLGEGLVLLPISDDVFDQLGDTAAPDGLGENFTRLSGGVVAAARELSKLAPVAYIETEYFGGVGTQSAAAWANGEEAVPPKSSDSNVVNAVLRAIGVRGAGFVDEFDAVGLGRFRDNDRWLERGEPG